MPYTFAIKFSGLCAFVPDRDVLGNDPLRRLDVLLLNATYFQDYFEYTERHHPLLAVDVKNLQGVPAGSPHVKAVFPLQFHNIRIYLRRRGEKKLIELDRGIKVINNTRIPGSEIPAPNSAEEHDIRWVPRIHQVMPEACRIDPMYMNERKNNDSVIIGRVILQEGEFRTHKVSYYRRNGLVAQFAPIVKDRSFEPQALAHWTILEHCDISDAFEVVVRVYEMTEDLGTVLELPLSPAAAEDCVEIDITNLCCGDYLNYVPNLPASYRLATRSTTFADYGSAGAYKIPEEDHDFQLFYAISERFSKNFNGDDSDDDVNKDDYVWWPIPVPLKSIPLGESGGADPLRCTMALFDPYSYDAERRVSPVASSAFRADSLATTLAPVFGPARPITFGAVENLSQGRFDFKIQRQPDQSNLCWAAVASSIDDHFRDEHWEQCKIASCALSEDCCPGYPQSCDRPWCTWSALECRDCFAPPIRGVAKFDEVIEQVREELPICASSGRHVGVIHGWLIEDNGRRQFEYSDPLGPPSAFMPYSKKPKIGVGSDKERWTLSYFTRKPR